MEDNRKVWLNGKVIPWAEATVPILSHGLSRGSAIFEAFGTHEIENGTATFRMDMHLERFEKTAKLLGMQLKYSTKEIADAVATLAFENKSGRGLVKIMAYWGEEAIINLVLQSKLDVAIFIVPASKESGLDKAKPISVCFSKWRKLHPETIPVEAKACANYLNGYLVRKDANDRGFDLGVVAGTDGFVAEGSMESIFIVKDGILKTPCLGRILKSVTRNSILQLAKDEGIPMEEASLQKDDVYTADEIFTCHTGIKISPVRLFEDREFVAPGPVTSRLSQIMEDVLAFRKEKYFHWFQKLF